MNVAVFGLGYVGSVSAACLAHAGHRVVGVDPNTDKVEKINAGESPVLEPQVPEMVTAALASGHLRAVTTPSEALDDADVSVLCVGTPSRPNGNIDLRYIEGVCREIGTALADDERSHCVVIRSTVMPGTAQRARDVLAEASGRTGDRAITVGVNPEFLREGQGVEDFLNPPLVLIGADDDATAATIEALYEGIEAPRFVEPVRTAEMVKYANNSFHAAKVTFANEIGAVASGLGIDGQRVMEILCADTKLNISPAYLRPGFAFGGSCLPKDVRALNYAAKSADVSTPMLSSLLISNEIQVQRVIDQIVEWGDRKVGFVGLSFKAGTDDLRESPLVEVVERVLGKGFDCTIYDPDVSPPDLIGGNRDFIEREIPHLDRFLVHDISDLVDRAEVIVVAKSGAEVVDAFANRDHGRKIIDLVRLTPDAVSSADYKGVAW